MSLIRNDIVESLLGGLSNYEHIAIDTHDNSRKSSKIEYQNILKNIVMPIAGSSSKIYVYKDYGKKGELKYFPKIVKEGKGKYEIDSNDFLKYREFWCGDDYSDIRGTVLFEIEADDIDIEKLLPQCFDPTIYTNIKTVLNKTAVEFAKRKISNEKKIVIGISGKGIDTLFLFANYSFLKSTLNKAFKLCQFSEGYKNLNFKN